MDYEKKYPITQQPGDFVLARWERGYKYVEFFYKDRLLGSVQGAAKLKAGIRLNDTELGVIQAKLSEKPIMMDLIIDGYHSPVNGSHPKKELKKTAVFFWMMFTFSLIASLMDGVYISTDFSQNSILTLINLFIVGSYCIAAVFVAKSQPWAYYYGFSVFVFVYLISLLLLLNLSIFSSIVFLFRTGFLVVFIINMKHAIQTQKHAKYGKFISEDLLDG